MSCPNQHDRGFTYLGILIAVVVLGIMLTAVGRIWSVTEQRERELQLLFVGHEIRMAIAAYYAHGHHYPQGLEDLVSDPQSPIPRRYLRRLYADPMTGAPDWQLLAAPGDAGIMGVASTSKLKPIKRTGFIPADLAFEDADCYCLWQFVYVPRTYRRSGSALPKP
jgi:type II secretory pathway pseudopilin PulG